jgi:hypothetical protein
MAGAVDKARAKMAAAPANMLRLALERVQFDSASMMSLPITVCRQRLNAAG